MQYSSGSLGRIFVIRFDDGEDIVAGIRRFTHAMGISSGLVVFLGALMEGELVTGPEQAVIPPVPHMEHFSGGWEVVGVATIYPGVEESRIHYHASVGKGREAHTGCLRRRATAYIVVEAVLFEISGLTAHRGYDAKAGLFLPVLERTLE